MLDIHFDEVKVYSCCTMCKQLAPTRICDPKWVLLEEYFYSCCFVVSFFSVLLLLLFPSFSTLFLFFLYLLVLNSSPCKGLVLVHCSETVLVNTCSVEATEVTNE
jgi:hypothetical protein